MTIKIEDEITQGIRQAIDDCQNHRNRASAVIVFPSLSPEVLEALSEDIEFLIERHLNTPCWVDEIL